MMKTDGLWAATVCMVVALTYGSTTTLADGWRGDGSGRYPNATPVLNWSKDTNVVWATALAEWSNASPLPVGKRVFVLSERSVLQCLDLDTGTNLWSRTNDYAQVMSAEELADLRRGEALQGRAVDAARKLQAEPGNLRLYDQMAAICRDVAADAGASNAFAIVRQFSPPPTHNDTGFTTPTPVSDGKTVYILTALGTAARYDLEGNRAWIRLVRKPTRGWGQSGSPLLADGKLLVHIDDMLYALSGETGETVWTFEGGSSHGTPVLVKVGDQSYIHTTGGDLVRVSDGVCVVAKVGGTAYNAAIIDGDVLYASDEGGTVAVTLSPGPSNTVTAVKKWTAMPKKARHYASPVLADGLLYVINAETFLSAIDSKVGTVVFEKKLELGDKKAEVGTAYPSLCFAGGKLFASGDGGITVVIEPGREYKEIARNSLGEKFRSTPIFLGDRILIRAMKKLYCIGNASR